MIEYLIEWIKETMGRKALTVGEYEPQTQTERLYKSFGQLVAWTEAEPAIKPYLAITWDGFEIVDITPADETGRHFFLSIIKTSKDGFEKVERLPGVVGASFVPRTLRYLEAAAQWAEVA